MKKELEKLSEIESMLSLKIESYQLSAKQTKSSKKQSMYFHLIRGLEHVREELRYTIKITRDYIK